MITASNIAHAAITTAACLLMLGFLAGCNERGTTTAPSGEPGSSMAPSAPVARAPVPATAQFSVGTETTDSLKAMTETAACSLENVISMADNSPNPGDAPNSYQAEKGKAYKMIGFATNKDAGTVPKTIRIVLAGAQIYGLNSVTGSERPDVANFFKVPAFSTAGYQTDAAFDDVAPGDYNVLVIETDGQTAVSCPTHQTITVK